MSARKDEPRSARPMTILLVDYRASIGCFREDAGERRHIQLIIVGYTAPVRQSDRLDPHFQKRRRVEKISAAQNRPASRLTHENPLVFVRRLRTYLPGAGHDNDPEAVRQDAPAVSPPS